MNSKVFKAKIDTKIHNRFDIWVKNVETGIEKQVGYAENIVLDQMYTRLCARSTYFVNIHFGTGSGTLSASRTGLFTHLGTKTVVNDAQSKAIPTSYWRQKIVLNPEEYVGSALSEVGVAYDATSTHLVTHALLKDMNGNVITLTKTAFDVVTIYATVYVTFSTGNANIVMCGMPNNNQLVNYLIGGATWWPNMYFYSGACQEAGNAVAEGCCTSVVLGTSSVLSITSDVPNKKFYTNTYRFPVDASNGHVAEFGLGKSQIEPVCRLQIPAVGIYAGLDLTGISVGTGNGIVTEFELPSKNIKQDSITVKVDGAVVSPSIELVKKINWRFNSVPEYVLTDTSYNGGADVSSNGAVIVALNYLRNYGIVYELYGGYVKLRQKIELGAYPNDCSVNNDGSVVAWVTNNAVGGFLCYEWNGTAYVKRADSPDTATNSSAVSLSGDGNTVAISSGSAFKVYDWNDTAWVKRADPASPVSGNIRCVRITANGLVLLVTYDTNVAVYDWSGTAWIRRTNPTGIIGTNVYRGAITDSGLTFVVTSDVSPYIRVYDWVDNAWVARPAPSDGLPGVGLSCAITPDGLLLAVMFQASPSYAVYDWVDGAWIKRVPSNAVALTGNPGVMGLSDNGDYLICGTYQAPYVGIFDMKARDTKITFATPPGLVTAEAVGTGDAVEDEFVLDNTPVSDLVVYLAGVETTAYTVNGATITFTAPPGNGVVITADYKYAPTITADYTVNGIHKTTQRVIDISAEIVFGEVV